MQIERLVYMANQVGKFFHAQGDAATIAGVEDHLKRFWTPAMRTQIVAHLEQGGVGLDPGVREAVKRLASKQPA